MTLRTYRPGDEQHQLAIYNSVAAELPNFKPATLIELQRRIRSRDFDPATRIYAEEGGKIVGYVSFQANGRVSYPWTLPGAERFREPLLEAQLAGLKAKGVRRAFAAYRTDWPTQAGFFLGRGFRHARDMVNFVVEFHDLPTAMAVMPVPATVEPSDVPDLFAMAPEMLRVDSPEALHDHLFRNPYFGKESLFGLRRRTDQKLAAAGILITDPQYADPRAIDSSMPCFRLGAFGTEGMQTKRINGLFSFLAPLDKSMMGMAMELVGIAAARLQDSDELDVLAAQCPSDVSLALSFYERHFRRQGSFPVFERSLT
ncbi:MAG: hypothetical protein U0744_05260 [Gemmataceae bacterium]